MKLTVKAARINAGLSQQDVADALNLSISGYAAKEQGRAKFYFDEIVQLTRLFNVSIDVFLGN